MQLSFLKLALLFSIVVPMSAHSMECDNFTDRDREVKDSLAAIDTFTHKAIDKALIATNKSKTKCDRKRLYRQLDKRLGGTLVGEVESYAEHSKDIEWLRKDQDDEGSIYHGISFWNYPLLKMGGIARSLKIAGHIVGSDKFGHFMSQGLDYYKIIHSEGGSLKKAIAWGNMTEDTYFGLGVSGIKSFADLSANYAGAMFWESILDGEHPYFACNEVDGKFVKVREFTWADHVNDSWDEGINCSQFAPHVLKVVAANLEKKGMTCPVKGKEDVCRNFVNVKDLHATISPVCLTMAPDTLYQFNPDLLKADMKGRRGD